jgi:hypothetical protein
LKAGGSVGPLVAVHVDPSPADPREFAVLLESCSRALPRGECRSDLEPAGESPAAFAAVRWLDEWQAHIDARVDGVSARSLTRDLTFSRDDARRERFRSVGLAIATIVDELRVGQGPNATAPVPATAPAADTETAPPVAGTPARAAVPSTPTPARGDSAGTSPAPADTNSRAHLARLDVGGLAGTGLASGPLRVGVYARFTYDLGVLPVYVDARGSYALTTSGATPYVTWLDLGLGAGARASISALRLELGLRALVCRTSASATDPETGESDTAASVVPGLGVDVRATWPESSALAATLGADSSWLLRAVRVTNAGREVGRVNAYNVGMVAGLRLYF